VVPSAESIPLEKWCALRAVATQTGISMQL
jgi:hypothetical protein